MSFVPLSSLYPKEPVNLDELRLVHARTNFDYLSLDQDGNAVVQNAPSNNKIFSNTTHFTLNAVVQPNGWWERNNCHCVIIGNFRETVALGNIPEGMLAADTYFHNDAQRSMKVAQPVLFAPDGFDVPVELESIVKRYPRGHTPEETERFKLRAVGDYFDEQKLPFYDVNFDDWIGNQNMGRGLEIQQALGLSEEGFRGRHMNSDSDLFERKMRRLYENLGLFRQGVPTVIDRYQSEISMAEQIEQDHTGLDEFLQRREQEGDPPNAMAFYRKHAGEYDLARRAILAAGPNAPKPAEA